MELCFFSVNKYNCCAINRKPRLNSTQHINYDWHFIDFHISMIFHMFYGPIKYLKLRQTCWFTEADPRRAKYERINNPRSAVSRYKLCPPGHIFRYKNQWTRCPLFITMYYNKHKIIVFCKLSSSQVWLIFYDSFEDIML